MYRFLTILWLFLGVYTEGIAQGCRERDSLALVAFHNALNGTTNWNLRTPYTTWLGVTFNTQGCVTILNFKQRNLSGQIAPEIGNLSELQVLMFENNPGISGTIPRTLGNLSNLCCISFSLCQLLGSIPPEIGQLRRAMDINFHGNLLTGSIPVQMGTMTALKNLTLSSNRLSGTIPSSFGLLRNLSFLELSDNSFSGNIPRELGDVSSLSWINLANNNFEGVLPSELGNLSNMSAFFIGNNKFSGDIPTSFVNMHELKGFAIDRNRFTSLPNLTASSFGSVWFGAKMQLGQNRLTFKHILQNISIGQRAIFEYRSQDSVYVDTTIFANINEAVTIDLKIDDTVQTNMYKWFKNEQFYQTTAVNKLILRGGRICPTDTFRCEITNPNAPDLTLYSRHIVINYLGLKAITNNQNICKGDTYRLPNGREVSKEGIYVDTLKAQGGCDSAVVTTILKFFEKPTAQNDPLDLPNDRPSIEIDPLINDDFRPNPLFRRLDSPKYGQLDSLPNNHFRYTRLPFLTGDVSFRYAICDRICPSVCDTATVTIHINDFEARNKIGITPSNRDGINDALVFDLLENDPQRFGNAKLLIFNLLGQVIYQQQPYDNKWMGTFQNGQELPKGAYLFLLIVNDKNKDREQICGSVTVIRED